MCVELIRVFGTVEIIISPHKFYFSTLGAVYVLLFTRVFFFVSLFVRRYTTMTTKAKNETRNNGVTIIKNIGFTREGYKNHYIRSHRTISTQKVKSKWNHNETPTRDYNAIKVQWSFPLEKRGCGGTGGGGWGVWRRGKHRLPWLSVRLTTHHLKKLQRHSHVSFMQITRKRQHPDTHRLIGNWSLPLHQPAGKARILIKHNTHGNIVLFLYRIDSCTHGRYWHASSHQSGKKEKKKKHRFCF